MVESFTNLWKRIEGFVLRTRYELNRGYLLKELRSEKALHKQRKEMVLKGMKAERRPSIHVSACRGVTTEEESTEMEESGRPSQKKVKYT